MPRPRLGAEPYEKLTVRLDKGTLEDIYQYQQRLQAQAMGLRVDLGGTARRLLLYGLQYAKDLERHEALRNSSGDATRGPVEAPVTLREDHPADHPPRGADQSVPKAAPARTIGRTGRKRPTAAKGDADGAAGI